MTEQVSDSDVDFTVDYFDDDQLDDPSCSVKILILFSFGFIPFIAYVFFSNL